MNNESVPYWNLVFCGGLMCYYIVFANGPGDQYSFLNGVIPKTQIIVLYATLHNFIRIKCKWSNPGKRVAPTLTPRRSNNWKGSLLDRPRLWSAKLLNWPIDKMVRVFSNNPGDGCIITGLVLLNPQNFTWCRSA